MSEEKKQPGLDEVMAHRARDVNEAQEYALGNLNVMIERIGYKETGNRQVEEENLQEIAKAGLAFLQHFTRLVGHIAMASNELATQQTRIANVMEAAYLDEVKARGEDVNDKNKPKERSFLGGRKIDA